MNARFIIVNYNSGDWLLRAVQSVCQYTDCKLSIVDNNSSDRSFSQVQKHYKNNTRIDLIANSENVGFAAANNQILSKLKEDYAVLMNPDCEIRGEGVSSLIHVLEQQTKIGLLGCLIENLDGSLQATSKRRFPTPKSAMMRMLGLHSVLPKFANFDYGQQGAKVDTVEPVEAISGAFMVVRKTAMQEVGILDEAYFMHCEDLDWCMRFANAGWQVACLNTVLVSHAKGVSSQARPIGVLRDLHDGMDRFFDNYYAEKTNFLIRIIVKVGIRVSLLIRIAKVWLWSKFSGVA